ncbi:MAG: glycosyltransferase [Gammaproteobacteria bacterium]|nr:MAG: glycosyltransferase [Gammaproteobacteria bacterium]
MSGSAPAVERLRLMLLVPSLQVGGAERQVTLLARHLDPARYAVTVVTIGAQDGAADGFARDLAAAPHVTMASLGRQGRWDLPGPLRRLVDLLHRERIDVIHSFLNLASMFGIAAARLTGIPHVSSAIRDGSDPNWLYRVCRLVQARACDVLVSNSEAGFDSRFRQRRPGFRVIYNGIDLARFTPDPARDARLRSELGLTGFRRVVGMVATLSVYKDHEAFLAMAARVAAARPDTGFIVVGDGPLRGIVEARRAALGLERSVVLAGRRLDADHVTQLLDVACLFTNFRVIEEGLSNSVLEAMACGIPVVATHGGGTRELIHEGVEGHLVADNDAAVAASHVIRLLENDEVRTAMGRRGREAVESRFSMDGCVQRYEEIYRSILGRT